MGLATRRRMGIERSLSPARAPRRRSARSRSKSKSPNSRWNPEPRSRCQPKRIPTHGATPRRTGGRRLLVVYGSDGLVPCGKWCPVQFPEVISLNVGGTHFTTCLSTLRRFEDTMLAAMFSGRHYLPLDAEGRFFIDRDGTYFGDILNFLRSGELPQRDRVLAVYREAQYYAIGPLLDSLEETQPLTGEKVRQAFLGLLPYYKDKTVSSIIKGMLTWLTDNPPAIPCFCPPENLKRIMEIAKLRAMHRKARFAKLKICVYKEDAPVTPYERPLFGTLHLDRSEGEAKLFKHQCEVDVSFGPWEGVADVYDLLHCIVSDLAERGVAAEQQCIGVCDKHLISHYYCKRPIYEFKITWW
ncbi:BTB/POZ domain-containing protein KCTD7-like [Scleropages formosus]|uniref:BTB/POZ domain-containing protein KCTD7 n=1 Tax=Scleropages formosus TaxID=113540 RepID=A0A0P7UPM9_SCLFO|nr:BTB/POZ domain-containing protein KCTD7-like [Scleropages formosus]